MTIQQILETRSDSKCELCTAQGTLSTMAVEPSDGTSNQSILLCTTCEAQINEPDTMDGNHWRCLNDSMWNTELAVQVMAWRQLKRLQKAGEGWAQDLLDMMYLDDAAQKWAEQGLVDDDREATRDSNGAVLQAGDNVTLIKDLEVKGAGFTAKRGTMVRGISLTDNPLHIEGKVNGTRLVLVSAYLKKQ